MLVKSKLFTKHGFFKPKILPAFIKLSIGIILEAYSTLILLKVIAIKAWGSILSYIVIDVSFSYGP